MPFALRIYLLTYGFLSLSHLLIQYYFAHKHVKKIPEPLILEDMRKAKVVALVPVYNESPWNLRRCLRSLLEQTHKDIHIVAIDDGSKNRQETAWVYEEFKIFKRVSIEMLPKNVGKREAQHQGYLRHPRADLYLTVDSDTVLHHDAVAKMAARFGDRTVGAVTGDVGVLNWRHNWLTRLIKLRYWSAFHVERAAQSYFQSVTCCSGPLSMYRGSALHEVWDRYITQTFLGRRCTFGDDRHLTNLMLHVGYRVVFEPKAHAITHVPERLFPDYLKQQWRWSMSFYREMLWNAKILGRHHPFMAYDLAMQAILPFMLLAGLIITTWVALHGHPRVALWYLGTVLLMGFIRSVYGWRRTKDRRFLVFMVYGLLHVTLLVPLRMYALVTLLAGRTAWGTR